MLRSLVLVALVACTAPDEDDRRRRPKDPVDTGSTSSFPVDTGTEPTTEPDPGAWLLETTEVRQVALTIDDAALESLAAAPEAWVPADLAIEGITLDRIGIRLKGNGSFRPIDDKPSLKLNLDKWVEDTELDGLDDLVLNNMVTDASYLRERTAYALYRELGIPAPRATHVELTLNGEPYGLYLLLEDVDGRFLNRWFEDGDGPLYEMFDVEITPSEVWQFDHDGGPDDRTALEGLAAVLTDPAARVSVEGAAWLDVEQFAAYFGATAVMGQFDAYPYSFPGDDVYLYVDPSDGRIRFLPHGADETFIDSFRPVDYVFGLLAVRCLEDPGCAEPWAEAVWAAQDASEAMGLADLTASWAADVLPTVKDDPSPPFTQQESTAAITAVQEYILGRRARLEAMPGLPPAQE